MKYIDIKEDDRLKQFMLGSMLGDGSIPKKDKNAANYRMTFGHSSKQLDYLKWKVEFLKDYGLSTGVITKVVAKSDRYKNGECVSYHTKCKSNPYFTRYRSMFYNDKHKTLSDCISDLDCFGLAVWYMDDGYLTLDKIRNKVFYRLSTDSFSKEELLKLINILKSNFDIKATINYGRELRISESDNDKFISLIEPYILPMFNYKLRVLNKQGELLERPITVGEDNQQPSLSGNTLEGSTTNNRVHVEVDSNVDTSALPGITGTVFRVTINKDYFNKSDILGDDIV